ncbi:MAG TPA: hypothetical protein VF553_11645 [Pyrinomonadaceae bacterium]|jgi:hypothetical protein
MLRLLERINGNNRIVVITGFNTDVEHQGITYHVQTEDKGLETPLILSLVYSGGAILASKRSPYDDLIAAGFNEQTLAERLQRQHRLICAAINAGRLEDLKQMSGRAAQERPVKRAEPLPLVTPAKTETPAVSDLTAKEPVSAPPPAADEPSPFSPPVHLTPPPPVVTASPPQPARAEQEQPQTGKAALHLGLLEERELRGGEFVTLRVRLSRGTAEARDAVPDATITLKILGTTFRPVISSARTDRDGIAIVFAALPRFSTGRAAILIRAASNGEDVEMRRIVHPS